MLKTAHRASSTAIASTLVLLAQSLASDSAQAQAQDWTHGWSGQATVYGWLPTINGAQEGRDGSPIVKLDAADVLSALDMAFMGSAEIRKDKFGLLFDMVYADLSQSGSIARGNIDTEVGTKLGIYTAAASYRVYEASRSFVDVYAGARFFDANLSFDIEGPNRGLSTGAGLSWTDGIVGVRGTVPLTERWSMSGFADIGGFDSGSDLSWEIYGGGNYAFSSAWAGTIGYRYMSIEYQATDRALLDINVQGPLFGITYKF